MKYWQLINVNGGVVKPAVSHTMNGDYSVIKQMIDELKDNLYEEETELSEKQVSEVLDRMLYFHETYFKEIPLADEQDKGFLWNIPYDIYKDMINIRDKGESDILDPTMLLYVFCSDNPTLAMGKYLKYLNQVISDNMDELDEIEAEYEEWGNEE